MPPSAPASANGTNVAGCRLAARRADTHRGFEGQLGAGLQREGRFGDSTRPSALAGAGRDSGSVVSQHERSPGQVRRGRCCRARRHRTRAPRLKRTRSGRRPSTARAGNSAQPSHCRRLAVDLTVTSGAAQAGHTHLQRERGRLARAERQLRLAAAREVALLLHGHSLAAQLQRRARSFERAHQQRRAIAAGFEIGRLRHQRHAARAAGVAAVDARVVRLLAFQRGEVAPVVAVADAGRRRGGCRTCVPVRRRTSPRR